MTTRMNFAKPAGTALSVRPFVFSAACMIAGACLSITAVAKEFPIAPEPGPATNMVIAPPTEFTLPNGMRIVIATRSGMPLVTARLVALSGSEADPVGRAGVAALTADVMVKGTRRHSALALAQAAEALGANLESTSGWHACGLAMTVTTPRLGPALDLLAEVVREPVFAPAEFQRAKRHALDNLRVALGDPGQIASMAMAQTMFGGGLYGAPPGGTPTSLKRIERSDLRNFHARAWRPDQVVLVLAGAIDDAHALPLVHASFDPWAAPDVRLPPAAATPARARTPAMTVIDMPDAGQSAVMVALPSIARNDPAFPTALVANAVLGAGYSSRLNQEVRIKRGLSYGASSVLDGRRLGGILIAAAQTKNDSAAQVAALMRNEITRFAASSIEPEEVAARKTSLTGNLARAIETTHGLAGAITALVVNGLAPASLGQQIDRIRAVDIDALRAYAVGHWLDPEIRTVIVGDARRFGDALRASDPAAVFIPGDRLDLDRRDLERTGF